jgi:hypothetical protein
VIRVAVVADAEAVSYIAARGGRLYLYADASGLKHVKTQPPSDPAIHFKQIAAVSFLFYVDDDIEEPAIWDVKFRRLPYPHVDVLWDGHQPGAAFGYANAPG